MQLIKLNLSEVFLCSVSEQCEATGPFLLRSLGLQVEQNLPYPAALLSEHLPTRTDGSSFMLVVPSMRKALGKQVGPGTIAETFRL